MRLAIKNNHATTVYQQAIASIFWLNSPSSHTWYIGPLDANNDTKVTSKRGKSK